MSVIEASKGNKETFDCGTYNKNLEGVAKCLGLPVEAFYQSKTIKQNRKLEADFEASQLLSLVKDYFSRNDQDTRKSFVAAVHDLVHAKN